MDDRAGTVAHFCGYKLFSQQREASDNSRQHRWRPRVLQSNGLPIVFDIPCATRAEAEAQAEATARHHAKQIGRPLPTEAQPRWELA